MILGKYQVTTLARKQPVSLKWCHLLPFPSPFWYLVSKKIHNYLGIIHTWRLLRGITVKICKIHWKFRIKQTSQQNASAHIYASCARLCARIFTKTFYYLMNLSFKFHKDRSFRCRDICKTILTFLP